MTAEEESRLVRSAAAGDGDAFEKLVLDNQKNVYNLALKLTGDRDDAMDASQDAFLRAFQNLRSFRGDCRVSVWLYRLTYNASMDIIKKSRRGTLVPIPTDEEGAEVDFPDPEPGPAQLIERREELLAVRRAVEELSPDKREIILLREYRDMSYTQIAQALGIEEGTVKSRLARARQSLADNLKKHGTFSSPAKSKKQRGGREDG